MIQKTDTGNLRLSVVICIVSDASHLRGCLNSLAVQIDPPAMEIIVPYSDHYKGIKEMEHEFPNVKFHHVASLKSFVSEKGRTREHHDELRGIGMRIARGEIIGLLEDHGRPDPYWARNLNNLHQNSYGVIGGAIDNEVDKALNWAVYFCDFGRYQPPVFEGPSDHISDANISYKREALQKVDKLLKDSFHETIVNYELKELGETLWLSPTVLVNQHRENLTLKSALVERYVWGRSYAGTISKGMGKKKRIIYSILSPFLPFLLAARKTREVCKKRSHLGAFFTALPITLILLIAWSVGELSGYVTNRPYSTNK